MDRADMFIRGVLFWEAAEATEDAVPGLDLSRERFMLWFLEVLADEGLCIERVRVIAAE